MIVAVKRNLCNCVKKPEKKFRTSTGFEPVTSRFTGVMLYQLSYEASDVGSRSIVGSYVTVKKMSVNDIWNISYTSCGNEMKWRNDRRSETQLMQLRKEVWKNFRLNTVALVFLRVSFGFRSGLRALYSVTFVFQNNDAKAGLQKFRWKGLFCLRRRRPKPSV